MITHWILVADASRARVLSTGESMCRLQVLHKLEHPAARTPSRQLSADEAGRLEKGRSGVLSAMDPRADRHDQEASRFAHILARLCDHAADRQEFTRLTLIAPPHFLGLLNSCISDKVRKTLTQAVTKDLTRLEVDALLRHFQADRS